MRNWDIFSLEKRIFELEKGGGSTPAPTSWDYSDTEAVDTHQKWIDGKSIVCKVVTFADKVINASSSYSDLIDGTPISSLNIDKIIDIIPFGHFASGNTTIYKTFTTYDATTNKIRVFPPTGGTYNGVIIYYTEKTVAKSTKRSKKA